MSEDALNLSREVGSIVNRHLHLSFRNMERQEVAQNSEPSSPRSKRRNGNEDSTSHKLIEKRRRDRMNGCLADLSRLIPSTYLKKGRGRVEKTEIVQMAIKYIQHLQQSGTGLPPKRQTKTLESSTQTTELYFDSNEACSTFIAGYNESMGEAVRFMVEFERDHGLGQIHSKLYEHLRVHLDDVSTSKDKLLKSYQGPSSSLGTPAPTFDSGYSSGPSEYASSDWSGNCSSSSSCKMTNPSTRNSLSLRNYAGQEHLEPVLEKPGFRVSDDLRSQYKFKAELKARFSFFEDLTNKSKRKCSENLNDERNKEPKWRFPIPLSTRPVNLVTHSGETTNNSGDYFGRAGNLPQLQPEQVHYESGNQNWYQPKHTEFYHDPSPQLHSMSPSSGRGRNSLNSPDYMSNQTKRSESSPSFGHLKHKNTPIFALHPSSTFYIPLVVNFGLLVPFLNEPEQMKISETQNLHPITISVNFCTKPMNDVQMFSSDNNIPQDYFSHDEGFDLRKRQDL